MQKGPASLGLFFWESLGAESVSNTGLSAPTSKAGSSGLPAGPRLLLGAEGARELAEASQRVTPAALSAVGHRFRYPKLDGALRHVLGREPDPAAPAGQGR